jgi:hypothetical protein
MNDDDEEAAGTFEEHLASLEMDDMNEELDDWPMEATEAEGPGQEATSERWGLGAERWESNP